MAIKHTLLIILLGYAVAAQELPGLLDKLSTDINEETLMNLRNSTELNMRKLCEENGGPDAYNKSAQASVDLQTCLKAHFDQEQIQKEIEDAKPKGQLDEVFIKYCGKKPELKACFMTFVETIKPCFAEQDQERLMLLVNVTEQLGEFVCLKNGVRMAIFIAENGPECFESKQKPLQECTNNTFLSGKSMKLNSIISNPISLKLDEEECTDLREVERCVVKVLKECPQPTTANIMESLFKFVHERSPCKKYTIANHEKHSRNMLDDAKPELVQGDSATGLSVTLTTLILTVLTTYLM